MGYTKLFNEIVMSTVWREADHVRILWVTMLALKDQYHTVNASLPGLADAARITIEQCEQALFVLESPDIHSRSTEFEGRRIEPCDGGWLILNGEKYRQRMGADERRAYKAQKQREYRAKQKEQEDVDNSVDKSSETRTPLTHKEEEADTDKPKIKTKASKRFVKPSLEEVTEYCKERNNTINPQTFLDHYESNGWKVGKNPMKDWKACVRTWEQRSNSNGQNQSTNQSRTGRVNSKLNQIAQDAIDRGETL